MLSSGYLQTNLVSDQAGTALIRDLNLVDPWGIGVAPSGGAFWVADHGSGKTSIYAGDVSGTPFARNPLVVTVPDGAPTGEVPNGTADFAVSLGAASGPAAFLMAGGSGTLSGWNQNIPLPAPSSQAQSAVVNAAAAYTGLTIAYDGAQNLLYAANFAQGSVDVFDRTFSPVTVAGAFADAAVPAGYAPYNVANLGGRMYVSYAKQNGGQINPAPGGGGLVAVFDYQGNLLKNLGSGALDGPWGLALAPASFGEYSGDLLVGNSGSGRILAFNTTTGALDGALAAPGGGAITIDGLRGLSFGNGQTAGDYNSLYFTAAPGGAEHGLFGAIKSAQFVDLTAAGVSATAYQGLAFQGVVATFSNASAGMSAGSYATTIYWGDGASSTGTVTALGGGRFNLAGTHVYSQLGLQSITVSIRDSQSHLAYASAVANVKTPMLTATGLSIGATEDSAFSGTVATFSDADGNLSANAYQAWIDWGDGTSSAGTVTGDGSGNFSVTGSHTYADEANFSVKTFIVDSDGDDITATGTASITDADALSATAMAVVATEGLAFSAAVAKFSDTNLAAVAGDFTATITWGDGSTSSGVINGADGQFIVSGSHAYAHSGQYAVNVAVKDPAPGT
ncbi:MAG TPA: TIGR03118 family protein, partial [Pirellulales bacterium]|nr:TIGR03118 family protein [Pirellulales bacterium]